MHRVAILFALILSISMDHAIFAKGLDQLAPSTEGSLEAGALNGEEAVDGQAVDLQDDDKQGLEQEAKADKEAEPLVQSATSKKIADKLLLQTSVNWAHVSASKGDWQAGAATEVTVGYRLPNKYRGISMWGLLRYTPMDFTAVIGLQSYRGVSESYLVGALAQMPIKEGLSGFASIEVGYMQVGMYESDHAATTEKNEFDRYGGQYAITTGLKWAVMEKIELGPRLAASFGTLQVTEVGGLVQFVF